jgi:hypothetical protein
MHESFETTLQKTPLPEILSMIDHYRVPGVVTISHQGIEKKIYLEGEFVTFARSNVDDDRLGEFLIRIGKIKQVDYDNSVDLLKKTKKRQGQIFVDLGCLNPKELFWAVKSQIKEIALSLFLWTDGKVVFKPGNFVEEESIKLRTPITELIIEGIRRIQNPRRLVGYLGGKDTILKIKTDALQIMESIQLGKEYFDLFNMVDGKTTLQNLVGNTQRNGIEVVRNLYSMLVLNVLERAESKTA